MEITDLRRVNEDREVIQERYPDSVWAESVNLSEPVDGQIWSKGVPPPMSFIAAPIRHGDRTYGVIRCSVLRAAPYYFGTDQLKTLSLIGSHIGEWYAGEVRLYRSNEERHWLEAYVQSVATLNVKAHVAGAGQRDELSFLRGALDSIRKALPEAHSSCIRLASEGHLKHLCTSPELEALGKNAEVVRSTFLPLTSNGDGKLSVAAVVYNSGKSQRIPDLAASEFSNLFYLDDTNALIVSPISSGEVTYGTIEVRFRRDSDVSDHAESALNLLGSQIGLYLFLADKIRDLKKEQSLRESEAKIQRETFENMGHQLKRPVAHARAVAIAMEKWLRKRGLLESEREALLTYLRQTLQVAWNIKMFGDLAALRPIRLKPAVLSESTLVSKIDLALHAARVRSEGDTKFIFERDNLDVVTRESVMVDTGLLDQMLDNLLDNAAKYAYSHTTVTVSVGLTHEGRFFYISVANKGIPVTPDFAKKLSQRGERSHQAVSGGEEGSGLGLYLVNEILSAHRGRLDVIPTDHRGVVRFRLLLPVELRRNSDALLSR